MTKRLLITALVLSAFGVGTGAHATCAGQRVIATVDAFDGADKVTVTVDMWGVSGCDTPAANPNVIYVGAPATLTIEGAENCAKATTAASDPFGFGTGVHDTEGDCGIDISWGGADRTYTPATDRTDGAYLVKDATVAGPDDSPGIVKVNGRTFLTAPGASGRHYVGIGAA